MRDMFQRILISIVLSLLGVGVASAQNSTAGMFQSQFSVQLITPFFPTVMQKALPRQPLLFPGSLVRGALKDPLTPIWRLQAAQVCDLPATDYGAGQPDDVTWPVVFRKTDTSDGASEASNFFGLDREEIKTLVGYQVGFSNFRFFALPLNIRSQVSRRLRLPGQCSFPVSAQDLEITLTLVADVDLLVVVGSRFTEGIKKKIEWSLTADHAAILQAADDARGAAYRVVLKRYVIALRMQGQ